MFFEKYALDFSFDCIKEEVEYTPISSPVIGTYDLSRLVVNGFLVQGNDLATMLEGVTMSFDVKDNGTCEFVTQDDSSMLSVTYYWSLNNSLLKLYVDENKTQLALQLVFDSNEIAMYDEQSSTSYIFTKKQS